MAEAGTNKIKFSILTPQKRVLEAIADAVYFPTTQGVVGVLPAHAPMMCHVGTGILHYDHDNMTSFLSISGGVAEVKENVLTLLVDAAEDAPGIDVGRAQKALERARKRLSETGDTIDSERAMASERRAMARLEAASRVSTSGTTLRH